MNTLATIRSERGEHVEHGGKYAGYYSGDDDGKDGVKDGMIANKFFFSLL